MMKQRYSKTKIIGTLGPASASLRTVTSMIRSGMDAARLNFSHGTAADHKRSLEIVRKAARAAGEPIPVIQDLQGPKIRIGDLVSPQITLEPRSAVTITTKDVPGDASRISTTYHRLPSDVKSGSRILLDDGKIELAVEAVRGGEIRCRVIIGGVLSPHKGINLPGVQVSAPSLTEKDKRDLMFGFRHDIDYVALSFVRKAHDVAALRDFIIENGPRGRKIPIIAKIEKAEAVADIDNILQETDAVMVARGDLGVELPAEDVPVLQKMLVRKCNALGKPVIIATQMLESMIANPRPTRAEASDVANAVLDGADAVMLSGETSVGRYPVESVATMDRIVCTTEAHGLPAPSSGADRFASTHEYDPLSRAACLLANDVHAAVIVALTHSGATAAHVAKFRPPARIIAVTDREKIMRRLNLIWGIRGLIVENLRKDTDAAFTMIRNRLLKEGFVRRGDTIVFVAGIPLFEGHPTNAIKLDRV